MMLSLSRRQRLYFNTFVTASNYNRVAAGFHMRHYSCINTSQRNVVQVSKSTSPLARQSAYFMCVHRFHSSTKVLSNSANVVPFQLADIGEGISEVEVLQWFIKPGDSISEFDPVCEVQSDKATVEITSRYNGVVKNLNYNIGDMAKVGTSLVDLEVDAATAAANKPRSSAAKEPKVEKPVESAKIDKQVRAMKTQRTYSIDPVLTPIVPDKAQPKQPPPPLETDTEIENTSGKVLTTPAVRRLAREHNLDLERIKPSGRNGRLLKSDVLEFVAVMADQKRASAKVRVEPGISVTDDPVVEDSQSLPKVMSEDVEVPIRGIQKQMVVSMTKSLDIPHFNFMEEIDVSATKDFREQLKAEAKDYGIKISYLPIILKAVSLGLLDYPGINATMSEDVTSVTHKASHNIGVAMDTPRGLLVPVVKNVQNLNIFEIAQELGRLQALGADNKLGENDLSGGTITISNIGSIGGTYASPVVLSPQVAICALGKLQTLPRFDEAGNVKAATVMNASWAADHRVIDGATMARFSNKVKHYLENPISLVTMLR
mmetsp:Transcript_9942/g.12998  ORF Transcript_9942/g.12998 Transcript_9942/m.12998 type:complete len:544 (+) Transcript_9942:363-1994(+)